MEIPLPVDLRSDTVTRPSPEMRRAMAEAEVGDDVFGDDVTVRRLEEVAARMMGKEAALLVPSGCMANLISVMAQAPAGSEILCAENSHIHCAESGAYARLAQVNKWPLRVDAQGRMDPREAAAAVHLGYGLPGGNSHKPTTSLLCLENTNNYSGGTVLDLPALEAPIRAVRAVYPALKVHLDGARLFNAATALGRPVRELAAVADSVSFCLSKGLGAPAGSLVCGSRDLVVEAHALRKMLGGGMRQAGVLAACGLVALSEGHRAQLAADHANCRRLGEGLAELPGVGLDPALLQTNILFFSWRGPQGGAGWLVEALRQEGVWCMAMGERVRMVTHRDVSSAQIEYALTTAARILKH